MPAKLAMTDCSWYSSSDVWSSTVSGVFSLPLPLFLSSSLQEVTARLRQQTVAAISAKLKIVKNLSHIHIYIIIVLQSFTSYFLHLTSYILLLTSYFLHLTSLFCCGRGSRARLCRLLPKGRKNPARMAYYWSIVPPPAYLKAMKGMTFCSISFSGVHLLK